MMTMISTTTAARPRPTAVDPIKTESLNILEDLIEQQRRVKLATAHAKG